MHPPPLFSNVRLNRNSENNIEAIRPTDPILNVLDTGYLWYGRFNTFQKGPFNSHKWDIYVFISLNKRYGTCLIVALCRCFIDWNCFLGETYDPWALFCCWGSDFILIHLWIVWESLRTSHNHCAKQCFLQVLLSSKWSLDTALFACDLLASKYMYEVIKTCSLF